MRNVEMMWGARKQPRSSRWQGLEAAAPARPVSSAEPVTGGLSEFVVRCRGAGSEGINIMRKLRKLSPLLQPDIRTRHEETSCGMGKGNVGDLVCSGLLAQDIGMFNDLVDQLGLLGRIQTACCSKLALGLACFGGNIRAEFRAERPGENSLETCK